MRDTPHIAQYLFEIVSQRGYRTYLASFSYGIAPVSLRYPFCGEAIACPLRMLSKRGKRSEKGEVGYNTQLAMLRHQKPHSAQQGGIAEIPADRAFVTF